MQDLQSHLDAELSATPVAPLGVVAVENQHESDTDKTHWQPVVPDGVASAEADPLGDGAVLALLLGQDLLDLERLVGRHRANLTAEENSQK